MTMTKKDKIQHLLITHLLEKGQISLTLPTGIILDIGITQQTKHGTQKCKDYCWISATQNERATFMDQYNMTVQYPDSLVLLNEMDEDGKTLHVLDVV